MGIGFGIGQPLQTSGDFEIKGDLLIAGSITGATSVTMAGVLAGMRLPVTILASGSPLLLTAASHFDKVLCLASGAAYTVYLPDPQENGTNKPPAGTWMVVYQASNSNTIIAADYPSGDPESLNHKRFLMPGYRDEYADGSFHTFNSNGGVSTCTFNTTGLLVGAAVLVVCNGYNWLGMPLCRLPYSLATV